MAKHNRLIERRFVTSDVELRSIGGRTYIEGYAAVFNKRSDNLGGFVEQVETTAFTKTINESDVRALFNHNPNYILGRSKAGTLALSIDTNGLYYKITAPDVTYARDLAVLLERGDVRESSFAFFNINDSWTETDDETPLRHLNEVGLVDISPVVFPAYPDATSGVIREAALTGLAKRSGCQVGDLCSIEAIRNAIRSGPKMSADEPQTSTRDGLTQAEWAKRELAKQADLEEQIRNWIA